MYDIGLKQIAPRLFRLLSAWSASKAICRTAGVNIEIDKNREYIWGSSELRRAIKAAGVALWSWNVDNDTLVMDRAGAELWGVDAAQPISFEHLSARIHPQDRDRVRAAFTATRAVVGPYEIDFRILLGADIRWISARGQGSDFGIVNRTMIGIFLDVTGRKQAEEGHELLAGEMSHRVKNLLAVASGLTHVALVVVH